MQKEDLTQGNIRKLVIRTVVPMVIAQLVSMFYNIVDRMFVGRISGIGAVALYLLYACFGAVNIYYLCLELQMQIFSIRWNM